MVSMVSCVISSSTRHIANLISQSNSPPPRSIVKMATSAVLRGGWLLGRTLARSRGFAAAAAATETPAWPSVAIVGVGQMGAAVAANLLRNGVTVNLFDLGGDANVPEALRGGQLDGAVWASTAAEAAEASSVVITALPRPENVSAAFEAESGILAGLKPGTTWIEHSTTDFENTIRIKDAVEAKGCFAVEAPLTGGMQARRRRTGGLQCRAQLSPARQRYPAAVGRVGTWLSCMSPRMMSRACHRPPFFCRHCEHHRLSPVAPLVHVCVSVARRPARVAAGAAHEVLREGKMVVLVGASEEVFEGQIASLVALSAPRIVRCGDFGHATVIKIFSNMLCAVHDCAIGEASRRGEIRGAAEHLLDHARGGSPRRAPRSARHRVVAFPLVPRLAPCCGPVSRRRVARSRVALSLMRAERRPRGCRLCVDARLNSPPTPPPDRQALCVAKKAGLDMKVRRRPW